MWHLVARPASPILTVLATLWAAKPCCVASDLHWSHGLEGTTQNEQCFAPSEESEEERDHQEDVEEALRRFWGSGRNGYTVSEEDVAAVVSANQEVLGKLETTASHDAAAASTASDTYGEVMPSGARQLARGLGLVQPSRRRRTDSSSREDDDGDSDASPTAAAVFWDLGCGVGKLVAQIFLEWPSVRAAVGVELSRQRVSRAQAAWRALRESGEASRLRARAEELRGKRLCSTSGGAGGRPNASSDPACATPSTAVEFIEGSMFAMDMSEVTHAYVASLCFDAELLAELARKLAADAPRLEAIASLRKFPDGLQGFTLSRKVRVDTSWTAGSASLTHVYTRDIQ